MGKGKKALLIVVCAALLVVASVMGTLAYLTDTDVAVNTFTVGNVHIKLDEAKVNAQGLPVKMVNGQETIADDRLVADRVSTEDPANPQGNQYHLQPGLSYTKDPTVTVKGTSEDAYVRMLVTVNDVEKLKAALPAGYYDSANNRVMLHMLVDGWSNEQWKFEKYTTKTAGEGAAAVTSGTYEFRYAQLVPKSEQDTGLPALFTAIKIPGENVTNEMIANLADVTITVEAHAIQAASMTDAADAWTKFDAEHTASNP